MATTVSAAAGKGIALDHMDRSVRPCDDFYTYANGTWLKTTAIPGDEAVFGAFNEIHIRNRAILHEILEDASNAGVSAPALERRVGDLYASGMDEAAIEAAGLTPIATELAAIEALRDRSELPALLARLHRIHVFAAFAVNVRADLKDSDANLLQLHQGGLGMPDRDYYLKTDTKSVELRGKYHDHVSKLVWLTRPDDPRAADVVSAIETDLAKASTTRTDLRDPYKNYHKLTRAELREQFGGFDWDAYFAALGIPDVPDVNVGQIDFFKRFVASVTEVDIAEWRTYLRVCLIRRFAPYLTAALEKEAFGFYSTTLQGVAEQHPRWRRVLDAVDAHIGEALGQLYVRRAFPPEAKARMLELIANLRVALGDRIRALDWMGPATKEQALAKLDALRVKVGYPDTWRDYSALRIDRGPYAANILRAKAFESARVLAKLGTPVDREEWGMNTPDVNAYYNSSNNEIVFPAGILQPPMFHLAADDAVNYGAIGMVIGHELTHGFDDKGSQFDARGNLRDWWQPEDRTAYESRTDLIVKQFDAYEPLPGVHVNGKLTLGENIADLGGAKVAFAAFRRSLGRKAEPSPIDGFTANQRFFLGFAQAWRRKIRDDALRVRLSIDPHSPGTLRVMGPLSNLPEFFEAFGAGEDAAMRRPEELRPAIW